MENRGYIIGFIREVGPKEGAMINSNYNIVNFIEQEVLMVYQNDKVYDSPSALYRAVSRMVKSGKLDAPKKQIVGDTTIIERWGPIELDEATGKAGLPHNSELYKKKVIRVVNGEKVCDAAGVLMVS